MNYFSFRSVGEAYLNMIDDEKNDIVFEKAVKNGETDTVMEMLRKRFVDINPNTKVVGKDGLPKEMYHGTDSIFNSFDIGKIGSARHSDSVGFFFLDSKDYAEGMYSNSYRTISCFINIENPIVLECNGIPMSLWDGEIGIDNQNGNDGYIINGYDTESENTGDYTDEEWAEMVEIRSEMQMVVAFKPNQIKFAFPTYENGILIPLSKRFDKRTDDMRY